jgi:hypothetical protein
MLCYVYIPNGIVTPGDYFPVNHIVTCSQQSCISHVLRWMVEISLWAIGAGAGIRLGHKEGGLKQFLGRINSKDRYLTAR